MKCIIPARGGSKRIPRKNIKEFNGKPMITYSIQTAISSGLFDEVIVSTDDNEIAYISEEYGVKIIKRSESTSNDTATMYDAIEETVRNGNITDDICVIYPCNPLLRVEDLQNAFKLFYKFGADNVSFVAKYPHPIQRALYKTDNGYLRYTNPEYRNTRTQDLDMRYYDAGMCYFINTERMLELKTMMLPFTIGHVVSEMYSIDIDTEEDWEIAEMKYRLTTPN